MQFFTLIAAALLAVPATHALVGYEGLHCEGEPNLHAACTGGCHPFVNSSSFRALGRNRPTPVCVKMWTGPGCTGTPYLYTRQSVQCTAVTFSAASFSCGYTECVE